MKRVVAQYFSLVFIVIFLTGCNRSISPQKNLEQSLKKMAISSSDEERFYALDDVAKNSFDAGEIDSADRYARELLDLSQKFKNSWNYGNAIQDGNLVLGRIALRQGRVQEAKNYLVKSGESPGSPVMDTFGPNMSLADDLLKNGDKEIVLSYLELCRKFWTMDGGKLDVWKKEIKAGEAPDFGPNLLY